MFNLQQKTLLLTLFLCFSYFNNTHTTYYKIVGDQSCYDPKPAKIKSYHVHMLYWGHSKSSVKKTFEIKK